MILKPVMRPAMRSPMGSAMDWGRSNDPNAEAIALLRKFNASVWLFCSGNVGGLQAGNYLDSTLGTPASIDGPIGGMLDAMGVVGPELVVVPNAGTASGAWVVSAGAVTRNGSSGGLAIVSTVDNAALASTKRYLVVVAATNVSGDPFGFRVGGSSTAYGPISTAGVYEYRVAGGDQPGVSFIPWGGSSGQATITVSVKEITGNPATQPTTANKPVLRSTGGKYYGEFDGINDSLLTGNLALTNTFSIVVAGNLSSLPSQQTLIGEDTGGAQVYVTSGGAIVFAKVGTGVLATTAAGEVVAGTPFVATATLAGGNAIIRKNGVQKVSTASALTLSATTGARIGGTFAGAEYCAGSLSALSVLQGAATNAELLTVEKWAASITPGGPTI